MVKIQAVEAERPGLRDYKDESNAALRNVGNYLNVNRRQSKKTYVHN